MTYKVIVKYTDGSEETLTMCNMDSKFRALHEARHYVDRHRVIESMDIKKEEEM